MNTGNKIILMPILLLVAFAKCKEPFEAPLLNEGPRFLAVTGFINTAPGAETRITLSRTLKLQDSITFMPEINAVVKLRSSSGTDINLYPDDKGHYTSAPLTLSPADNYKIVITTLDGKQYESDFEQNKTTPPVDSLSWKQDENVSIYVNTHDPTNNSRYYWWDYTETWQYQTPQASIYGLNGNTIYVKPPEEQTVVCWQNAESVNLLLGSTIQLTDDVVSMQPLQEIVKGDKKINYRYSILVRQHVISATAYKYWELIRQNSQNLGTLFDQQPSQIRGNIHSTTDPEEPVVGYISVANEEAKRIFISHAEVTGWSFDPFDGYNCSPTIISQNPDPYFYDYPDTSYLPWYFVTGGGLYLLPKDCLDCRLKGGTNIKPAFW